MGLYEFGDKLILEYKDFFFVWEPAWEAFRPFQRFEWNGYSFQMNDDMYCSDPTDSLYGYVYPQMKEVCDFIHDQSNGTAIKLITPPGGTEWFRDRFVNFTECAPRDLQSWKRMVKNKPRTCRKAPRGKKLTRRILH